LLLLLLLLFPGCQRSLPTHDVFFLTAYIDQSKGDYLDHDGQHLLEDNAVTEDRGF
jgi:hypothetical protein